MAAVTLHENDILGHVNPDDSLHNQAVVTGGCVTILEKYGIKLELCWHLDGNEACVEVKMSAFGYSIVLGEACLEAGKTTTLSGHIDDIAKAEVTVSFDTDPLQLCFEAKACAKFLGSWHCADTGKHCISI